MKKKFLTATLAVTMVVGSSLSAFAEDVDVSKTYDGGQVIDGSTAWNTTDGDNYLISETPVTVKFANDPFIRKENGEDKNWFNFVFETLASDSAKGVTMRADAFSWTYGDSTTEPTCTVETSWGEDWSSFMEISKSDITITATKSDANTVKFAIAFGGGATETYTIAYPSGVPSDLRFHVGADGGKITVNSVTYGTDSTPDPTTEASSNSTPDPTTAAGGNNTPAPTTKPSKPSTPATGDVAPVAALAAVAVVACAAVVVSKKKVTE